MKGKSKITKSILIVLFIVLIVAAFIMLRKHMGVKVGTEKISLRVFEETPSIGREAWLYLKDIADMDDGSVLAEEVDIDKLPVYKTKNYVTSDDGEFVFIMSLSRERVEKIAEDIAKKIDSEIAAIEYKYYKDFYEYSSVKKTSLSEQMKNIESAKITYHNGMRASIYNNGKISLDGVDDRLPGKHSKEYEGHKQGECLLSDEEADEIIKYLAEKYGKFMKFTEPAYIAYNEGNSSHGYIGYENSGNIKKRIVNHDLNYIRFGVIEDAGKCYWLSLFNTYDYVDYIGDYPIISVDEAKEALFSGEYMTDIPPIILRLAEIKETDIAKITVNYVEPSSGYQEYYIPFYKFYVDITEGYNRTLKELNKQSDLDDGVKTYGIFYIPAIRSEYLMDYNRPNNNTFWD